MKPIEQCRSSRGAGWCSLLSLISLLTVGIVYRGEAAIVAEIPPTEIGCACVSAPILVSNPTFEIENLVQVQVVEVVPFTIVADQHHGVGCTHIISARGYPIVPG